ncbi:hypothetical protein IAR55_005989 [Kwoniella newhampshirensis]|uniref:Uncharacterized protein n=1 Tax=Kwoniella newhampshirensis TaxID=1651941 RepID=A0AAW0YI66_9TREE
MFSLTLLALLPSLANATQPTVQYGKSAQGATIVKNGPDREKGQGYSHLTVFDGNGTRLATATLNAAGASDYHVGGIDYEKTPNTGRIQLRRSSELILPYTLDSKHLWREPETVVQNPSYFHFNDPEPVDVDVIDGIMRLYCAPDQQNGTIFIYEAA